MRIVRSWLLECCPVDLSAEELAELLTAKGAEVERIESYHRDHNERRYDAPLFGTRGLYRKGK